MAGRANDKLEAHNPTPCSLCAVHARPARRNQVRDSLPRTKVRATAASVEASLDCPDFASVILPPCSTVRARACTRVRRAEGDTIWSAGVVKGDMIVGLDLLALRRRSTATHKCWLWSSCFIRRCICCASPTGPHTDLSFTQPSERRLGCFLQYSLPQGCCLLPYFAHGRLAVHTIIAWPWAGQSSSSYTDCVTSECWIDCRSLSKKDPTCASHTCRTQASSILHNASSHELGGSR